MPTPRDLLRETRAFAGACLARIVAIEAVERAITIASLAFTALIPLGIVVGAVTPTSESNALVQSLVRRFGLQGETRHLLEQLFAPPEDVKSAVSVIGIALLLVSSLGFTRALQRVYEQSWQLPRMGIRGTPSGLLWLVCVVAYVALVAGIRDGIVDAAGPVLSDIVALLSLVAIWWITPWLLLSRRLGWRPLLPTALVTAFVATVIGIGSTLWMPDAIRDAAERYGQIGVAIALVSWLVVVGFGIVLCAAIGAVITQYREGARASAT
jgi:membrane protein